LLEAQTLQACSFLIVTVGRDLLSHDLGGLHPFYLLLATTSDLPSHDPLDHDLDHGLPLPLSWI
jgi:hypothetical protein